MADRIVQECPVTLPTGQPASIGLFHPSPYFFDSQDQLATIIRVAGKFAGDPPYVGGPITCIGTTMDSVYRLRRFTFNVPAVQTNPQNVGSVVIDPGVGWLVSLFADAPGVTRGDLWVQVGRTRDNNFDPAVWSQVMAQGYISGVVCPIIPGGTDISSIDTAKGGHVRTHTPTLFSPGQEFACVAPVGMRYRVRAITLGLTTAAGGAARVVTVQIVRGSHTAWAWPTPTAVPPASTHTFRLQAGLGYIFTGAAGQTQLGIPPDVTLIENDTLQTSTTNLAAGDQWVAAILTTEDYIDTPNLFPPA